MSQAGVPSGVWGARSIVLKPVALAVAQEGGGAGAEPTAGASALRRRLRTSPGGHRSLGRGGSWNGGTWLVSLLRDRGNGHLEVHAKFRQTSRNVSRLVCLSTAINAGAALGERLGAAEIPPRPSGCRRPEPAPWAGAVRSAATRRRGGAGIAALRRGLRPPGRARNPQAGPHPPRPGPPGSASGEALDSASVPSGWSENFSHCRKGTWETFVRGRLGDSLNHKSFQQGRLRHPLSGEPRGGWGPNPGPCHDPPRSAA